MVEERQRQRQTPLARIENPRSNAMDNYYGFGRGLDVRYDTQLPHQYQYPLGGQTRVSDVEPDLTDFGSPYRAGPPTEGVPMTPEWQWPEGYWPQNYQSGIANSEKGSSILDDYLNYTNSNFDFDFGKQKISWTPELLGGNLDANVSPEGLYLGMKWGI
jgi:hypothetical protein